MKDAEQTVTDLFHGRPGHVVATLRLSCRAYKLLGNPIAVLVVLDPT